MRWCRFERDGKPFWGIVEDYEAVEEIDGSPFGDYRHTGKRTMTSHVKYLPPTIPSTFFCVGLNYHAHIEHAAARGNPVAKVPERPEIGYRANNALIGNGDHIVKPADLEGPLETEPEVVAIIGTEIRHASRDEAADAIFGWTIGNDVSARPWQRADRTLWRAKNSDTFKPTGPWIETDFDPSGATTTTTVNGETKSTFETGGMIFDAIDYIVEITKYITMSPGDHLWMGAADTVEMDVGDTVEINVSGIGTLHNTVVAAGS